MFKFLWYWKFSILSFAVFVVLVLSNKVIDSMAEMSRLFAFGGVMLIIWMLEAIFYVIGHLREKAA